MVNHCKSHNDEYGTFDLLPFMESMEIKPLLDGHIIETNKKEFRVVRYQWNDGGERKIGCQRHRLLFKDDFIVMPKQIHCYVFVDITIGGPKSKSFAKTPSYVLNAIKENRVVIKNKNHPVI